MSKFEQYLEAVRNVVEEDFRSINEARGKTEMISITPDALYVSIGTNLSNLSNENPQVRLKGLKNFHQVKDDSTAKKLVNLSKNEIIDKIVIPQKKFLKIGDYLFTLGTNLIAFHKGSYDDYKDKENLKKTIKYN